MSVTVEFYGIARQRAGVASIQVNANSVGEALDQLTIQLPHWAEACLIRGELKPVFLANVNAQQFVTGRIHPLDQGDHLLILAADVGG